MRGRRARRIGLVVGVAAVAVVAAVATWTTTNHRTFRPIDSNQPSDAPSAGGPVVYYEVLDADASRLMERRLDGHSLARQVAQRTDAGYGRTWTVDPTGTIAVALIPGVDDQRLEAVSIATGEALWSARTPTAPVDQAVWSADGRHVALASIGGESTGREALVIDATDGGVVRVAIPDDAVLQGFDRDDALILRQHVPSPQGVNVGWRFLRVDSAAATIERLLVVPDVGPASDGSEDVDPAAGLAVDTTLGPNDKGTAVRLRTLAGGRARTLTTLPSVDRVGFDPAGTGVAISAAQTIRFIGLDGRSSELFSGPDPIAEFGWSGDGDYLVVATDRRGANLTIHERATGRSVALPQTDPLAQLQLVRVIGGAPLPPVPLPATEPSPTAGAAGDGLVPPSTLDRVLTFARCNT